MKRKGILLLSLDIAVLLGFAIIPIVEIVKWIQRKVDKKK